MTRRESGALARAQGLAWQAQVLADLEVLRRQDFIDGRRPVSELTRAIRKPDGTVVQVPVPGEGGVADVLCWVGPTTWALEAKSTTSTRWGFADLVLDQALFLSEWADPPHRRSAVVLAIHPPRQGRRAFLLDWLALGPVWALWHQGGAVRGGASLTVSDALELGVPWDGGRALVGGAK